MKISILRLNRKCNNHNKRIGTCKHYYVGPESIPYKILKYFPYIDGCVPIKYCIKCGDEIWRRE